MDYLVEKVTWLLDVIYKSTILGGIVASLAGAFIIYIIREVFSFTLNFQIKTWEAVVSLAVETDNSTNTELLKTREVAIVWRNRRTNAMKGSIKQVCYNDDKAKSEKRKILGVWNDDKPMFLVNNKKDDTCKSAVFLKYLYAGNYSGKFLRCQIDNTIVMGDITLSNISLISCIKMTFTKNKKATL